MHPAPTALPFSAVSFVPGGQAVRPTMEYPN
jgi:hypothetical protein